MARSADTATCCKETESQNDTVFVRQHRHAHFLQENERER